MSIGVMSSGEGEGQGCVLRSERYRGYIVRPVCDLSSPDISLPMLNNK